MAKKVFCYKCRKDVEYKVQQHLLTRHLNGKDYEYMGREAFCAECGEVLFTNLKALYDVYRAANGKA